MLAGLLNLKESWTLRPGRSSLSCQHSDRSHARRALSAPHPCLLPRPHRPPWRPQPLLCAGPALLSTEGQPHPSSFQATDSPLGNDRFLRPTCRGPGPRLRPARWRRPRPGPDAPVDRPRRGWRARGGHSICWPPLPGTGFHRLSPISGAPLRPAGNGLAVGFEARPATGQEQARPSFKGPRGPGAAELAPPGTPLHRMEPRRQAGCWPAGLPLGGPCRGVQVARSRFDRNFFSVWPHLPGEQSLESLEGNPGLKVLLEKKKKKKAPF